MGTVAVLREEEKVLGDGDGDVFALYLLDLAGSAAEQQKVC